MPSTDPIPSHESFLHDSPTLSQKWAALRLNVQAWYSRWALAQGRPDIGQEGDLVWTYSQCTIPSEASLVDDSQIDRVLDWYRRQTPLRGAIFWFLHPTPPAPTRLSARLYARGVGPNWEPHWMWCELEGRAAVPDEEREAAAAAAATFEIRVAGVGEEEEESDHTDSVAALTRVLPRRVWHLVAWQHGRRVGGCTLNVTTGEHGVGGLFDMWVAKNARRQGIGTALSRATCSLARRQGCLHVVLNATDQGESVYRRAGFQSLGRGCTWFLSDRTLAKPAPGRDVIAFLEGVGTGDVPALDAIGTRLTAAQLQEPTLNEMTPLEIAVRCRQPGAAAWLLGRGGVAAGPRRRPGCHVAVGARVEGARAGAAGGASGAGATARREVDGDAAARGD